jgi:sigma-B regulation protein RsbU (phosphoserine phosphatase)
MTEPQAIILAVDDEPRNIRLLEAFLIPGGHQVIRAFNGEEALQQVQRERPDLILLDLMMPIMNGYEVLKQLKADDRWRDISVVMISALDDIKKIAQCIERGAEDYLPKPFDPVLLRARVSACLEKRRLRDQAQEYSDRLERELQAARDIQMGMVPTIFPAPESNRPVEIYATLEPARQVGGDLYDFFYNDEGQLCFLIGDVSDKGAPAALFMARTKALVRLVADLLRTSDGGPPTPEQIMNRVNEELCRDNGTQMFVTLLLGVLDPISGALKCCNAGHLAPYVLGRNGVKPLETARGIPLGISVSRGYDSTGWTLSPGDCLFIFTDGITEAMDSEGKLFGKERLEEALRAVAGEDPTKIVAAVIKKISKFTNAAPQSDDIAAMALRYGLDGYVVG